MRLHLNPLETKVIGVIIFKADSPLHVGAGGDGTLRTFFRLPTGELAIPCSTWKGAFRRVSEKIARTMQFTGIEGLAVKLYREGPRGITYSSGDEFEMFVDEFLKALNGEDSSLVGDGPEKLREISRELGYSDEEIERIKRREVSANELAENYLALHCPISELYGNRIIAGKLKFLDTVLGKLEVKVRPGVGIDRSTRKAKGGILYRTQVLDRGLKVKLTFIADNLIPGSSSSKLFASTLKFIRELGISIGARKSTGLGALNMVEGKFYVLNLREDAEKDTMLIGNPLKKVSPQNLEGFLRWLSG